MKEHKYALVTHYSFDSETPVWIFNTLEEAKEELKRQFDEEVRIETEENDRILGDDMEIDVDPEGFCASLTIRWHGENVDVTEWSIGDVRN